MFLKVRQGQGRSVPNGCAQYPTPGKSLFVSPPNDPILSASNVPLYGMFVVWLILNIIFTHVISIIHDAPYLFTLGNLGLRQNGFHPLWTLITVRTSSMYDSSATLLKTILKQVEAWASPKEAAGCYITMGLLTLLPLQYGTTWSPWQCWTTQMT